MTVAYDGTGFHGFAANHGVKTVGGALTTALEKVLGHRVELTCAGRTDKGVHAWGQVVSFDARADDLDAERLHKSLNAMCGPAIVVREVDVPPADFDARHSATARRYRYTIVNREVPDVFRRTTAWHVERPLDLDLLRLGCDPFLGEHDFSSFCRVPPNGGSLTRRVRDARWVDCGDGVLEFWIEANAFCHQMVRSIVGTLVEVGWAKRTAGEIRSIMAAKDRHRAAQIAPPHGLCLWEVEYAGLTAATRLQV